MRLVPARRVERRIDQLRLADSRPAIAAGRCSAAHIGAAAADRDAKGLAAPDDLAQRQQQAPQQARRDLGRHGPAIAAVVDIEFEHAARAPRGRRRSRAAIAASRSDSRAPMAALSCSRRRRRPARSLAAKSRSSTASSNCRAWPTMLCRALAIAAMRGAEILPVDDLGKADDGVERGLDLVDHLAQRIEVGLALARATRRRVARRCAARGRDSRGSAPSRGRRRARRWRSTRPSSTSPSATGASTNGWCRARAGRHRALEQPAAVAAQRAPDQRPARRAVDPVDMPRGVAFPFEQARLAAPRPASGRRSGGGPAARARAMRRRALLLEPLDPLDHVADAAARRRPAARLGRRLQAAAPRRRW